MQAVILVGGEGTRLRPLTYTTPKQMLPIIDQPMIEWVLGHLSGHGITDVVLSLGYLPEAFQRSYPEGEVNGVTLRYAVEPERLDTAGAIRFAASEAGIDDTFVVLNGDVMTDLDLTSLIAFHRDHDALGTIALHPVADPSAFGVVPTEPDGRVISFIEKPPRDEAPTNLINAGIYVFEPSVLNLIPEGRRVSVERETFPLLVEQGRLYAAPDDAYWLDTGTPRALLQAHFDLLDGVRTLPASATAIHTAGVWIDGSASIEGSVSENAFVAHGATVAAGSVVTHSMIGRGVTVGEGAHVGDAIIFPGAVIEPGAVVTNSIVGANGIIGRDARLEGGTVTGAHHVVEASSILVDLRVPA